MNTVLEIPVKRYVLNYITARYGSPWQPVKRYKDSRMILNLLERAPNRYEKYAAGETVLIVRLNSYQVKYHGCYLSQNSIDEFNEFIKQCILDDILNYSRFVKAGVGLKTSERVKVMIRKEHKSPRNVPPEEGKKFFSQKEMINDILDKYQIDEADMTYDMVIKHVQRSAERK
jgi:hypothetical protein